MIAQAFRTLLVFAVLLGALAFAGLAQPPHVPANFLELSR
jgi:hypothetical protein